MVNLETAIHEESEQIIHKERYGERFNFVVRAHNFIFPLKYFPGSGEPQTWDTKRLAWSVAFVWAIERLKSPSYRRFVTLCSSYEWQSHMISSVRFVWCSSSFEGKYAEETCFLLSVRKFRFSLTYLLRMIACSLDARCQETFHVTSSSRLSHWEWQISIDCRIGNP